MQENEQLRLLYLENYERLVCYARSVIADADAAEDLVQETFLIAQSKLTQLLSSPNPQGWLMNTLRNVVGNYYQRERFLTRYVLAEPRAEEVAEASFSVETLYAGLISEEELRLLVWIYCEKRSCQEAAERLNISLAACKKRIQRAKRALRDALEKL